LLELMMRSTASKKRVTQTDASVSERLEARVTTEQKRFFQHAAALKGVTLTDFLLGSLQEAALRTVEEHRVLKLSVADQRTFVEALMNPPSPNTALRKAAERHSRIAARQ
jgi:uncharacterized protein (DUF1778 family)